MSKIMQTPKPELPPEEPKAFLVPKWMFAAAVFIVCGTASATAFVMGLLYVSQGDLDDLRAEIDETYVSEGELASFGHCVESQVEDMYKHIRDATDIVNVRVEKHGSITRVALTSNDKSVAEQMFASHRDRKNLTSGGAMKVAELEILQQAIRTEIEVDNKLRSLDELRISFQNCIPVIE